MTTVRVMSTGELRTHVIQPEVAIAHNRIRVSSVSSSDGDDLELTLSVTPARWKDSVQSIKIDFGKSEHEYVTPGQGKLRKRQASSTPAATTVVPTAAASSALDVTFPTPSSSSPTATSAHQDLGFSFIDTPLLPPAFPGSDSVTLHAPAV